MLDADVEEGLVVVVGVDFIESFEDVESFTDLPEYRMLLVQCGKVFIGELDKEVGVVEVGTDVGGCYDA